MLHLFSSGLRIATVGNYRSAIAAVYGGSSDSSSLSDKVAIKQLLKEMFVERWDLPLVRGLTEPPFEPISNAPLLLYIKLAFLLAVTTFRRGS